MIFYKTSVMSPRTPDRRLLILPQDWASVCSFGHVFLKFENWLSKVQYLWIFFRNSKLLKMKILRIQYNC